MAWSAWTCPPRRPGGRKNASRRDEIRACRRWSCGMQPNDRRFFMRKTAVLIASALCAGLAFASAADAQLLGGGARGGLGGGLGGVTGGLTGSAGGGFGANPGLSGSQITDTAGRGVGVARSTASRAKTKAADTAAAG